MNRKRMITVFCVVVLAISAFAFTRSAAPLGKDKDQAQQARAIPEYTVYRHLFHHHVVLKQKAQELERQGKDGKALRAFYQKQANLSDDEARAFDEVASECEQEVAQQDAKAKAIIDAGLARYPGGKIPAGEKPPEAPAELKALWEERNAIILRARDHLHAALGDQEFQRFEEFVERDVKPNITAEPLNRQRPSTPMGLRQRPK